MGCPWHARTDGAPHRIGWTSGETPQVVLQRGGELWLKVEREHHLKEEAGAGRPVGSSRQREAGDGGDEEQCPLRLAETVPGVAAGGAGAVAAAVYGFAPSHSQQQTSFTCTRSWERAFPRGMEARRKYWT